MGKYATHHEEQLRWYYTESRGALGLSIADATPADLRAEHDATPADLRAEDVASPAEYGKMNGRIGKDASDAETA